MDTFLVVAAGFTIGVLLHQLAGWRAEILERRGK